MPEQSAQQEIYDFATSFSGWVLDRLRTEGTVKREYAMPNLKRTGIRSRQQEQEYYKLLLALHTKARKWCKKELGLTYAEAREKAKAELGENELARYNAYDDMIPHDKVGGHLAIGNEILIPDSRDMDITSQFYHALAHELLHSIRQEASGVLEFDGSWQLVPEDYDGPSVGTTLEVMEFFGQLEALLLPQFCSAEPKYQPKIEHPEYVPFDMGRLKKANDYFRGRAKRRLCEFVQDIERAWTLKREGQSELYKSAYEDLDKKLKEIWSFESIIYLYLVERFTPDRVEEANQAVKDLIRYLEDDSQGSFWESGANAGICIGLLDEGKFNADSAAYFVGNLAALDTRNNLREEWPKAFHMPAEEVQSKYIDPITKPIAEMRKLVNMGRLRRAAYRLFGI